jgi:argininosuccinate synthase
MKSHGVYETPGVTILREALQALEQLTLDKDTLHYKDIVAHKYAELTYNGRWFTPLREALDAFMRETQKNNSGQVRLKLYKGNIILVGRQSPYSLYREDYATFGEEDVYNQSDAEGFIKLYGLPMKVQAMVDIEGLGHGRYKEPDYSKFKRD